MHRRGIVLLPAVLKVNVCCFSCEPVEHCYAASLFVKSDTNKKLRIIWLVVRMRGTRHETQATHGAREEGLAGSSDG